MARGDFTRVVPDVMFYLDRNGFERAVVFEAGYSDPGPRGPQWCGKHGMGIRFLLRGPKGVAQFLFNTGWVPGEKGVSPQLADLYPSGYDLGYHARVPQYESHEEWSPAQECEYMDGEQCSHRTTFCSSSSWRAMWPCGERCAKFTTG